MTEKTVSVQLTKKLPLPELAELYREAGWLEEGDSLQSLEKMLENSFAVAAAFDEEHHLLGLMRALSDGVSDAYMLDLVVRRDLRKAGIGRKILNALTEHLKGIGISWIVCIGAPGTEPFYRRTDAAEMTDYLPWRF